MPKCRTSTHWPSRTPLLTQHYAVAHPSLPNYLALIGGDTFGVTFDCTKCIYNAITLPDLIEASGRTWKAYQEDMPSPCFAGAESGNYAMKHNPFVYFEPIRLDAARCRRSVVPITAAIRRPGRRDDAQLRLHHAEPVQRCA